MAYNMSLEGSKRVIYPYEKHPAGILVYTPYDVSVHIMRFNRSQNRNTYKQIIETAENYGGYVGSYEIKKNTIIHSPKVCGFINFLHTPQIRNLKIKDNILTLEYLFFSEKHAKHAHLELIWQRILR